MQALELKVPPVAVFLICAAGMWALSRGLPTASIDLPYAPLVAIALAVPGGAVAVAGIFAFRRQSTTVNPTKPDAASSIVFTGIYGFTRNPMYLGVATMLAAWGIYLANVVALFVLPLFVAYIAKFQIKPEERALLANFGSDYADYMATVRRWL
jgi:protein-S-isoprenylcysteine O-methyltransferase Ste14